MALPQAIGRSETHLVRHAHFEMLRLGESFTVDEVITLMNLEVVVGAVENGRRYLYDAHGFHDGMISISIYREELQTSMTGG